jgi:hypothetical protein
VWWADSPGTEPAEAQPATPSSPAEGGALDRRHFPFEPARSLQRLGYEENAKTLASSSNARLSHAAQASLGSHRRRAPAQRCGIAPVFWTDSAHRHDRLRHPYHHRDPKQWRRRFLLSRLSGIRRADQLGFTRPDEIARLTPGPAALWKIDEDDHTRWLFSLRVGVKFHDGSVVTADAMIWNLDRFYNEKSPQFDAPASAIVRSFVNMLDRYQKIDDRTIAIYTKSPFSFFPYMVPTMLMVSPTQWEKAERSWTEFAKTPSGTGPFRITKVVPGPIRRNEPQRGLLGQGPHSEARETDRDTDAGGDDTARRLAFGPGRLDRGAATRRHPLVESSGVPYQPLALPACLAVHSQRTSVSGPARAQGAELRDRSR